MKKTCENCKAQDYHGQCLLRYKQKRVYVPKYEPVHTLIPDENCPKPKTYMEYLKLSN